MGCNFNSEATENDDSCIYLEFNNLMPEDGLVFFIDSSINNYKVVYPQRYQTLFSLLSPLY